MSTQVTPLDEWLATQGESRRSAPGMAGIKGSLSLKVTGKPVAMLQVDDGFVEVTPSGGDSTAVINFIDDKTLIDVFTGALNPVVAVLQGRMNTEGDLLLATKSLLGLQVGHPFAPATQGDQHGS